jgi:hypothetical protein
MSRSSAVALVFLANTLLSGCASGRLRVRTYAQDKRNVFRAVTEHLDRAEGRGRTTPVIAWTTMELSAEDDYLLPDAEALERVRSPNGCVVNQAGEVGPRSDFLIA